MFIYAINIYIYPQQSGAILHYIELTDHLETHLEKLHQKVNEQRRGLIHGIKHHKHNQLKSLKHYTSNPHYTCLWLTMTLRFM